MQKENVQGRRVFSFKLYALCETTHAPKLASKPCWSVLFFWQSADDRQRQVPTVPFEPRDEQKTTRECSAPSASGRTPPSFLCCFWYFFALQFPLRSETNWRSAVAHYRARFPRRWGPRAALVSDIAPEGARPRWARACAPRRSRATCLSEGASWCRARASASRGSRAALSSEGARLRARAVSARCFTREWSSGIRFDGIENLRCPIQGHMTQRLHFFCSAKRVETCFMIHIMESFITISIYIFSNF